MNASTLPRTPRMYARRLLESLEPRLLLSTSPIITDAFNDGPSGTKKPLIARAPTGFDLPGGTYQLAAGYDYNARVAGINYTAVPSSAYFNTPAAVGISIATSGNYVKPTRLEISGSIAMILTTGTSTSGLLGFYSSMPTAYNSNPRLNFTGLELTSTGALTLVQNGTPSTSIPYTGSFTMGSYHTLTYTVDTTTGAVSNVTLSGSTSTYNFTTTAFTSAATLFAGLGGVSPSGSTGQTHFNAFAVNSQIPALNNASPWGIAASAGSRGTFNTWAPQVASLGGKWARVFPLFSQIEATQGTFSWTTADANIATANANNMFLSAKLGLGVSWINSNTSLFPTSNIPAWSDYVTQTVNHVEGSVQWYEVWNEPNLVTGNTPANYATTMIAAYDAAKAADPNAQVGLSVASVDINYLKQTIAAGAADHFDFICVHPYEDLGTLRTAGYESQFMSIVPTLRKMLAAVNPAKANVPIWITEVGEQIGVNGNTTTTQAEDLVKAYSMGIAQNFAKIQWYEGKDGDSGFGLYDSSGNPRLAATAYGNLTGALGSTPTYLGWVQPNERDYGFIFKGATTNVMALWAPAGVTDTVTFTGAVQVLNPLTGAITNLAANAPLTLTNSPVLILGVPAALVTSAATNKSYPFPWGGNYTNATTAMLTAGSTNTELGLHWLNANGTSTATTAYGSPVRLSNDAAGHISQRFTVDPNMTGYTPQNLTLTVVVRRNEANASGGFKVQYESTTGWVSSPTGWYTVPGNTQWYTKTFSLPNAEFDGKWGYNFWITSDSNANGPFYIQSVTVTRTNALPAGPAGWSAGDINTPARPGSSAYANGIFTIQGGGADIAGTSDQFHFDRQSVTGDHTLSARITSTSSSDSLAQSGVMFRDSTAAGSMLASVSVTPAGSVVFSYRTSTGGTAASVSVNVRKASPSAPVWVKLVRAGTTYTAYYSINGTTWTPVGTPQTITFANSTYLAGLAVTARNNTLLNTTTFDTVLLT